MRKYLGLVFALVGAAALAASVTATWQHPTQNTDDSAIPATGAGSIASTRIEWGSCNGAAFGTAVGEVVVPAPAATTVIPNLGVGTWCARAFSKNTYGAESDASGVVQKVIAAPKPKPPANFSIG